MSYFYKIAILGRALESLTYHSDEMIALGQLVSVKLRSTNLIEGVVIGVDLEMPEFKTAAIQSVLELYYTSQQIELAKFICEYYVCYLGQALAMFHPKTSLDIVQDTMHNKEDYKDTIELSKAQQQASDFIDTKQIALLFADTGSGKTEIYIKQMIKNLLFGKQSLLLMPEIALTPQMEKRLKVIFGESVAIWHSKISKKNKESIISKVEKNQIKIVAGARSALFLPYSDLGLIIVDEEHDESYKSDQTPRVNVKDLSIYIGSKYNTKVILGSATPSLGSFAKVPYFRLKETFFQTSKKYIFDDSSLSVSNLILNKIKQNTKNQKQTIVFLPTRANFRYQVCDSCGKSIECPFCSVSMSLHKNNKLLKCHYCNYTAAISEICPSCSSGVIKNFRMGTAEVCETLMEELPKTNVVKFDRDAIKTERELKKILSDFNDGLISVLVGTQMLSKGHDYHNVTLAVILGIDSVLSMQSYRARERAVGLLIQLCGRSGRNGYGEVVIQTANAEFFEQFLVGGDYEDFLREELEFRGELYPPNVKIAKVYFSHANFEIAKKQMEEALVILSQFDIEIVGYGEAFVFKVANKFRYEIFVRSKSAQKLIQALHYVKHLGSVDMDFLS